VLVIRVFAVYESQPDAERYEQHAELCRQVPGVTFRHGRVLRTIQGAPALHYYAEFEFPNMDAFKAVADSEEFRATGKDAAEMGLPHSVYLAAVE
jgi:EthD domain-containing protein